MNLPTIRIAVILCLVVSMTIQPMSAYAMAGPCSGDVCEQTQMCSGCGCCEVSHDKERCCCCKSPSPETVKSDAESQDSVGAVTSTSELNNVAVEGRCTCGVSSPPMDRTNPREQVTRQTSPRVASLDFVVLDDEVVPILRPRVIDDAPGSRADFSQRVLCVWRI
ncbi:hypothetical protein [Rhodopirellula sp. SWK7]|uniref:hypothetical protein n=1 Tax=Rhodopirellula sp. SWK7 TaxID=595460 RepID=UPI0002BF0AB8|nr:hypothetical protein [Rhodopirellula sp. SWK7]EMI41345.1 secreted protein [Rhodopirellula sp. SWK7]